MLDKETAQIWIVEICRDLEVRLLPRLVWSPRRRVGRYSGSGRRVRVGPRCWRQVENSLLHELAHHVVHDRNLKERRHHGEHFYQALLAVTECAEMRYGWEYNWLNEYDTVRRRRIFDRVAYVRRLAYLQSLPQPCVAEEVEA